MAAIISEKFRIFNAKQFLESLSEGSSDTGSDRSRMYFFVGRPQAWASYLEISSIDGTDQFAPGDGVYVGASWAAATFKATITEVLDGALLVESVGPLITDAPALGSTLTGYNQSTNADKLVTATTGVYRFATENIPPVPLDNQTEKFSIYDDIIAAKRITSSYARHVVRRYNWDLINNPKFDMYKPDYFATPTGGGQIGKSTATGATSLANAKFYIMNQSYEVFKCLYNGESESAPTGVNIAHEPKTNPQPGLGSYSNGIFTAPDGSYVWKYMYTIPTDDVLAFLSTDFMPINAAGEATRSATEAAAVNGAVHVAVVPNKGTLTAPVAGTFYTPVVGDGSGAVAEVTIAGGEVTAVSMVQPGSGYTYGSIAFTTGVPLGTAGSTEAVGLFSDQNLTVSETVTATDTPAVQPVLSPQGGHGSDFEVELNSKRVMTNIRLTFIENAGDFPVDNDFRRIGIIKDPYEFGTTTFATADTLNGLKAIKIQNATGDYIPDETIVQSVNGGTAAGTVVSWTLDAGSPSPTPSTPGSGVLKYFQTSAASAHLDGGVVRAFESDAANTVDGLQSGSAGNVETGLANGTELVGSIFNGGLATPEIENNSGDLVYIENRRLITRAADQIEDIKLVIEF